jgi:hypothetical protein
VRFEVTSFSRFKIWKAAAYRRRLIIIENNKIKKRIPYAGVFV